MVNIKIEGVSYQVEEGLTILEAAKACGYESLNPSKGFLKSWNVTL